MTIKSQIIGAIFATSLWLPNTATADPIIHLVLAGKARAEVVVPDDLPITTNGARMAYDWPTLETPRVYRGEIQFRGTPAAYSPTEIDRHAHQAAERIARAAGDDYEGLLILDQESMGFDAETCERWHEPEWQLTMEVVRDAKYPGEDLSDPAIARKVKATARSIYNQRAHRLSLGYVNAVRKLMPSARIGYYSLTAYGLDADTAVPLFRSVDVVCPGVYFRGSGANEQAYEDLVDRKLRRAAFAADLGRGKPIVAFVSPGANGGWPLLTGDALRWQLTMPLDAGAQELILWHQVDTPEQAKAFSESLATGEVGRVIRAVDDEYNRPSLPAHEALASIRLRIDALEAQREVDGAEITALRQQADTINTLLEERDALLPHAGTDARLAEIDRKLGEMGAKP